MFKDVVAHVDGTEADAVRLAYAEHLAQLFEGMVIGLHVHHLPEVIAVTEPTGSHYLQAMMDESARLGEETDARVKPLIERLAVPGQLRRIDIMQGSLRHAVATEARLADLFVGLRPYGGPGRDAAIEEAALFDSGRACLFVPPEGRPPPAYQRIAVAWKNSRPAARALAEAMPLLRRAESVAVLLVEEISAEQRGEVPGSAVAAHLARHGVKVELRPIVGWSDVAGALLNEAARLDAQMLVMGGFGSARLWEWVVGGVTRRVLSDATLPVFMAH